ncbi:hypothetical protein JVT61DRAFT_1598 [Boletus reticuloceps]|uniref:GTP-binding protein 2 n=1 Tax=Boletus reticuloceps TaxID=495285 RepID=A0A8I2YQI8_9AGAM|nr:hypothetical protein JVT61DRAFT_1598 [Boletus reticuloceps]
MFGESDSESPRVPSPWDSLTSPPSSPPQQNGTQGIPKLVPEAEEGNIEYKLQLLSPSPRRFTHLVTQLKWRLLEGGGQAYYELGVADSGTLVGLPRQQLEESLETLEMMAGEIGASVIVVKEIEVPPELSSLAESQLERWDKLRMMKHDEESPTISTTELETELSTTDVTDADESTCYSPVTPPSSLGGESDAVKLQLPITPLPFDSALPLFTMDLGDDVADYADNKAQDNDVLSHCVPELSVSLGISFVYKPRPMRIRATHNTHFDYSKKRIKKNGYPPSTNSTSHTANPVTQGDSEVLHPSGGAKSQLRRDRRDKQRVMKPDALLTYVSTCRSTEPPTDSADHHTIPPCPTDESNLSVAESPLIAAVDTQTVDGQETTAIASSEPRLIVEVLVVRKLSLDEVFLDFEGFSLQ